jgi:hypothetical protein
MKLFHHADLYSFTAAEFLTHLSIRGSFRHPHLHINWPTFRIKHRLLSLSLEIPPITQLSYWTAFKARRILATHYEVLMFTRELNSENYQIVPLLGSSWANFQASQLSRTRRQAAASDAKLNAGRGQSAPVCLRFSTHISIMYGDTKLCWPLKISLRLLTRSLFKFVITLMEHTRRNKAQSTTILVMLTV